jgi:uncharacterized protein
MPTDEQAAGVPHDDRAVLGASTVVPSRFTVRVPLDGRSEVFLLNTLTDAQAVISSDVDDHVFSGRPAGPGSARELVDATAQLVDHGFLVSDRAADQAGLDSYFESVRADATDVRVTVLTTLRCNFGCGYCVQGEHGADAAHMSPETAERVARWIESQIDHVGPARLGVTFFGGEPLLNMPAVEHIARRAHEIGAARGITVTLDLITNGLLLTPQVVDLLLPYGLSGIKVTLDGDRATHDRQRPLRGGQGTFDRILANLSAVAGRCRIAIGGNVDADALADCERLLDRLASAPFAASIANVSFKPIVKRAEPAGGRVIPLVASEGAEGECGPAAGHAGACDTCAFAGDALARLRQQTMRRGFATPDGVHMGPCELHRRHAHAIGPDGTRYVCPGFAGSEAHAIGHVMRPARAAERVMAERRERHAAWRACGDCAFVPVCAGGCSVAAHHEQHDMEAPACHRPAFEAAAADLARAALSQE